MTKHAVAKTFGLYEWQDGSYQSAPEPGIRFFEGFNSSVLNPAKWDSYTRDGDRANSELNVVRSANAVISGGNLGILAEYSLNAFSGYDAEDETSITRSYATAQIATKETFLYGTFDARIRPCSAAGTWPLFWILGHSWQASQPYTANIAGHAWPQMETGWWEIDIMEFLNGTRAFNNCAAHVKVGGGSNSSTAEVELPFDASSRFMVYRLVWAADKLEWWLDAEDGNGFILLHSITNTNHIPTNPGYVICHTAIGGLGGTPDSGDYPDTSLYSWVRVT